MPRKPQQQRAKATVASIVEAAMIVLATQGPKGVTTRKIADVAGIGVGSLYEYFTCKEDILYLVCDFIHSEMELGVANAMAALEMGVRSFDSSAGGLGGCPFAPGARGNVGRIHCIRWAPMTW